MGSHCCGPPRAFHCFVHGPFAPLDGVAKRISAIHAVLCNGSADYTEQVEICQLCCARLLLGQRVDHLDSFRHNRRHPHGVLAVQTSHFHLHLLRQRRPRRLPVSQCLLSGGIRSIDQQATNGAALSRSLRLSAPQSHGVKLHHHLVRGDIGCRQKGRSLPRSEKTVTLFSLSFHRLFISLCYHVLSESAVW